MQLASTQFFEPIRQTSSMIVLVVEVLLLPQYLRVIVAPGASHSVMGLASWYMGSGFSVGGAVGFRLSHFC